MSTLMFAVDVAYNEYERRLLRFDRRIRRGALDVASILARTPGVSNDLHTRILNLVLTQIQTQMRTSRAEWRALILRGLELPFEAWTSCDALVVVLEYERAGTVDKAVEALTVSAQSANAPDP